MMAKLKDALTAESVRFENTAKNPDNTAQTLKAARTRFENSHRDYWRKVHEAWQAVKDGKSIGKACADAGGVDPDDVKEIAT
jgi:hypothetical protein